MKRRHLALGAALLLAAGLLLFGDRHPADTVVTAVERPATPHAPLVRAAASSAQAAPQVLGLIQRERLIGAADERFGSSAPTLFARHDWTPPPPPPPPPAPAAVTPPAPPQAPPLPFSVIGKALEGGKWAVFLVAGERTQIAAEGVVLDGAWRVDRIAPPVMSLTYLPLNQVQQLHIGVFD